MSRAVPAVQRHRLRAVASGLLLAAGLWAAGCGLEQELDLELPDFDEGTALECYLTPGQPYRLLLTESAGFLDSLEVDDVGKFLESILLPGARVTITHGTTRVELTETLSYDARFRQVHNYASERLVPANYTDSFRLQVVLPDGWGTVRAATKLLPPVASDSVAVDFQNAGDEVKLARVQTYATDPNPSAIDRLHFVLQRIYPSPRGELDLVVSDERLTPGAKPGIVSLYKYRPGDTLLAITAHVDVDFEVYRTSIQLANLSNGSPFAQPSPVRGNLHTSVGGRQALGIFTTYAYTADTVAIPR